MPPKMDRYITEPNKYTRFSYRTSYQVGSFTKSVGKKVTQFKRNTLGNVHSSDRVVFIKTNEPESDPLSILEGKKKNFVVSKRNTNKSIMEERKMNSSQKISQQQWIQNVQSQSYQGLRDYNEDRILIHQNVKINNNYVNVFAVFDGHGGSTASQFLKINFLKTFQLFSQSNSIQLSLKKTIQQLQNKILKNGIKINSGSCATILVIKERAYWTANVGDSRILKIRNFQQVSQLTEDHKPENPKQFNRIENLGGKIYRNMVIDEITKQRAYGPFRVFPSKLSVTRALGDFLIKKNQEENVINAEPDINSGIIEPSDVFLVISDGAYQKFTNNELSIIFSSKTKVSVKQRLSNYFSEVKKRETQDNTSVIVIQISQKMKSSETQSSSRNQTSLLNIEVKV